MHAQALVAVLTSPRCTACFQPAGLWRGAAAREHDVPRCHPGLHHEPSELTRGRRPAQLQRFGTGGGRRTQRRPRLPRARTPHSFSFPCRSLSALCVLVLALNNPPDVRPALCVAHALVRLLFPATLPSSFLPLLFFDRWGQRGLGYGMSDAARGLGDRGELNGEHARLLRHFNVLWKGPPGQRDLEKICQTLVTLHLVREQRVRAGHALRGWAGCTVDAHGIF